MDIGEIEARFGCSAYSSVGRDIRSQAVAAEARSLAMTVCGLCPDSRERSLALTRLEESVMWARASIARGIHGDGEGGD